MEAKTKAPAIVVMAYNRSEPLKRLLNSLHTAVYPHPVPLIISIDKSDTDEVLRAAEAFEWKFGEKTIIAHPQNLGLRKHAFACGDLTKQFGEVIFLEDDLLVAPSFYLFAKQAVEFYAQQPQIAGISLYSFQYYEQAAIPFTPLQDESDVFFLQYPSSWGSVLLHNSWQAFRSWYDKGQRIDAKDKLPIGVKNWSEKSWVKYYLKFLVEKQLFYVYPRISLSTTFSDEGEHHFGSTTKYQVPLQLTPVQSFRFKTFEQSYSVYDVYYEILPYKLNQLVPELAAYDYVVDLNGTREPDLFEERYMLTTRAATEAVLSFDYQLTPAVMNVILKVPGQAISLAEKAHITSMSNVRNNLYHYSHVTLTYLIQLMKQKSKKVMNSRWLKKKFRDTFGQQLR